MIRFGPSGNSIAFYEDGHKHTYEAMAWISHMGLNAYEYSFGRGVRIGEQSAAKIKEEAEKYGIALSVHAPYYINLASDDAEKFEKNLAYFVESSRAAKWLGATRVVFHPGSCAKIERGQALSFTRRNLTQILARMDDMGYGDLVYCPETMGKHNQLGSLEEVVALCHVDARILPTIDFGHLHTRGLGALQTTEDFEAVLQALFSGIGAARTRKMHVHFSKIEFTKMGEKAHRTFDEEGFGPDFALLAPLLVKYDMQPTIICESNGTMAKDACAMKELYENEKAR